MFGLRDGGGGGLRVKKKFVCLNQASHFWLSIQNFIFSQWKIDLWWVGGLAWGWGGSCQITPPPPGWGWSLETGMQCVCHGTVVAWSER